VFPGFSSSITASPATLIRPMASQTSLEITVLAGCLIAAIFSRSFFVSLTPKSYKLLKILCDKYLHILSFARG